MNSTSEKFSNKPSSTKIPTPVSPFKRSSSVRIRGEKANLSSSMPISSTINEHGDYSNHSAWNINFTPLNLNRSRQIGSSNKFCFDDDLESIGSVASNFSVATTNSTCEHANFAKNGTTYSGKSHKYIVHCSSGRNEQEEYLTPTQRANKSIKRLKSLLQLAKEKLREKEEEIFKLNKEITDLKSYKESEEPSNDSNQNLNETPKNTPIGFELLQSASQNIPKVASERFSELSPVKHLYDTTSNLKMSPTLSQEGLADKSSIASEFVLSSMADSGNFDDLPSSASVYSKDSIGFMTPLEFKQIQQEQSPALNDTSNEDEKIKIIRMYEKKLDDKKLEYEIELSNVIKTQEEKNLKIICEFESKLKEEELKFEARWNELLKATEEEKMLIVNRFEEKLEEEKKKYRESLIDYKAHDGKVKDVAFEMTYCKKVEEEKMIYETSLMDIKEKFRTEQLLIQKKFDDAMIAERKKFEDNLKSIKQLSDSQVSDLTKKLSELETQYSELLPKYEKAVSQREQLEKENEVLKSSLKQQEENHQKLFLTIYQKGQEAAKLELEDQKEEMSEKVPKKVSVPELLAQLKITEVELENLQDKEYRAAHTEGRGLCLLSSKEAISLWLLAARKAMYKRLAEAQGKSSKKENCGSDPEATLQFLKSAVYYFLTDRENHLGHLKAIESILAFSSAEKSNIEKLYLNRY